MIMPSFLLPMPFRAREFTPTGYGSQRIFWQEPDELTSLEGRFAEWMSHVAETETLFRRFVYENKDIKETDLRLHRLAIYGLLHDGEYLAFEHVKYGMESSENRKTIEPTLVVLEQKLKTLFDVLVAWHGDPNAQPDVPDSFKRSMQEVAENKIVDFEKSK